MSLLDQFEYPLPVLGTSIEKLVVEAAEGVTARGGFTVRNEGGGRLSGTLLSNCPAISFDSERFEANRAQVGYSVNTDYYGAGDNVSSSIVIMSNGGEKVIPVFIKIIPPAVAAGDEKISSLKDFMAYAAREPEKAGVLFVSQKFADWLERLGFGCMSVYGRLRDDGGRERALDNFFVLCKLKSRTALTADTLLVEAEARPGVVEMLTGQICVKRFGRGYVGEDVRVTKGADWLSVVPARLLNLSFGETDTAAVVYRINTGLIDKNALSGKIEIGDIVVDVRIKRKKPVEFMLMKPFYRFGETGGIICVNNTGRAVTVDAETKDGFIRLAEKRFEFGADGHIPFTVRNTPMIMAQMALRKQPAVTGSIVVTAVAGGAVYEKKLTVTVGDGFEI